MDALADASLDNLIHVDEIGEKIAQSFLLYFANPKNRDIIERLRVGGKRHHWYNNKQLHLHSVPIYCHTRDNE